MGWTLRSDQPAGRQRYESGGSFPLWVALASTLAALGLFFSATVPAIAEMRFLSEVQDQRLQLDAELSTSLEQDGVHRLGLESDLQSILVELDKRGIPLDSVLSETTRRDPR